MKLWKIGLLLTVVLALLVVPITAAAQTPAPAGGKIIVERSDLPPDLLKQLEIKQQLDRRVETAGKWAGLGREIGLAVNEGLQALTKTADDFSKTGVGRFTMFLIAWKVVWTDFLQLFFGTLFFLTGLVFFVWSWYINARTRRILVNGKEELVQPSEAVQIGHAIWFIAFILFIVIVIFV